MNSRNIRPTHLIPTRGAIRAALLRAALLLAVALAGGPGLFAQDEPAAPQAAPAATRSSDELPKRKDMTVPIAEELLNNPPRDWVILKSDEVVVCESVVPRPDTLAQRAATIAAKEQERRGKSGDALTAIQEELNQLNYLRITLPNDKEHPEYQVPISRIAEIVHHEDLILKRVDALLAENNRETAFELLLRLETQRRDWPGIAERHNRVLFVDAEARLAEGKAESALVLFSELHRLAPDFPRLSERIGEAFDQVISRALADRNQQAARHFLNKLAGMFSQHPVFMKHAAALSQETNALLDQAEQARAAGRHAEAAEIASRAAVVWPRAANLMARFKPMAERYQRLTVGVIDLPTDFSGSDNLSAAQQRAVSLTQTPLFEPDRYVGGELYYRTRYFDAWEPFDLGRRLLLTVRQTRQPWDALPIVDAPAIAAAIGSHLDPDDPRYDERLAAYIEAIRVLSPVEFEIRFRRVPPRVEPLLDALVPVVAPVDTANNEDSPPQGSFVLREADQDRALFVRSRAEPDGLPRYHVAEIIEQRFASHEKVVQALRQGEASLAPDLPDWIIRRLTRDEEFKRQFFILNYALPETHVIQLNPASPPLRVRELRRALAYALDRDTILKQIVLRDPAAAHGRVSTSPFPASSSANSVVVRPHPYDLSAALALVLAAQQQLGDGVPPLRMRVPADPLAQAAAARLIADWKRIGIDVAVVDPLSAASEDDGWDLEYRTLHMADPVVALWPFLAARPTASVDALLPFPDWLKQRLIDVDRSAELGRALAEVRELHEMLWSEVRYVPLWEIDRFFVVRKTVQGLPNPPVHCYHGVERWTMQAWFNTEQL